MVAPLRFFFVFFYFTSRAKASSFAPSGFSQLVFWSFPAVWHKSCSTFITLTAWYPLRRRGQRSRAAFGGLCWYLLASTRLLTLLEFDLIEPIWISWQSAQAFMVWCIWSMNRRCNVRLRATQQMVLLFKKGKKEKLFPLIFHYALALC